MILLSINKFILLNLWTKYKKLFQGDIIAILFLRYMDN